jgi:DNA recombination protein Rad52
MMAFTDPQLRQLKAKLDPRHVKTRNANGMELSYVEAWHTIAEANRIFGYDAWDRRTIFTSCVWIGARAGNHQAAYIAKVRVTVRAGDLNVIREGSGTGEANAPTPGQAHELALKTAETDATKRALATFGNPFGLALYDPDLAGVRKPSHRAPHPSTNKLQGPWTLRSASGVSLFTYEEDSGFIDALTQAMSDAADIERLYDVWEKNIETLRAIHRASKEPSGVVPKLVAHLRACAVALVKGHNNGVDVPAPVTNEHDLCQIAGPRQKIDKSVLTISEPKRVRCKGHLRYVARQPCLICGRSPSHAHHVRYAQPRGLGLKVSDEFTVPLCAIHHHHIHTTGKEREWWLEQNIDPLKIASELWHKSREVDPRVVGGALDSASPESFVDQSVPKPGGDAGSVVR